ncbi:MAG: pilus assembly PilX N-terminal domain-containing protein [bacterium]|nr:pilus assembly PilX N-terminal domain-containing protein [bacterium]
MSLLRSTKSDVGKDQQGLIAIFSVLIIMGILTLMTIGFTNITRLAQRRSLDDALKTQAFYAAESGVNSVLTGINDGTIDDETNTCNELSSVIDYAIDNTRGIAISCLLVDPTPTSLEYDDVSEAGLGEPVIAKITSASGALIDRLRFEWDSTSGTAHGINSASILPGNQGPTLLDDASWGNNVGMVRVDLVPASVAPSNRAGLVNRGHVFYLYPTSDSSVASSATTAAFQGALEQGGTLYTRCNSPGTYRCIGNINVFPAANSYYIRIYSYYNPIKLKVTLLTAAGTELEMNDGQAVIDSTGQANDVYRRIQVRLPLTPDIDGLHEVFALFSGDSICKRYIGVPAPGNTVVDVPAGVNDPACNIN